MTKEKESPFVFEEGLSRLENLIEALESGDLDLDKSLLLFEEGVGLARKLSRKLDEAEKRLEVLMKDEDGRIYVREFTTEPEGD